MHSKALPTPRSTEHRLGEKPTPPAAGSLHDPARHSGLSHLGAQYWVFCTSTPYTPCGKRARLSFLQTFGPLISTRLQPGGSTAAKPQPLQRFRGCWKPLKRLQSVAVTDTRLKPGANERGRACNKLRCARGKLNRTKSLILGEGRHIVHGQCGEKTFQLLFTRQMSRQFDHKFAVSLEPPAMALHGRQRPMFAAHDVGHPVQGIREVLARIPTPPLPVAYQNYCDCRSYIKS